MGGDNGARRGWLYRARFWTILVERKMCPALVMILKIRRQHTAQVTLIEDDNVIETFAADRADDALHIGVLPRGSWCGDDLLNTHRLDTVTEGLAIGSIPVSQQKARRGVPGEGLGHLAREPDLGSDFG